MNIAITPDHSARTHHKYGMSKLNAFQECGGFVSRDGTSLAAEEGTFLHEIMDVVTRALALALAQGKRETSAIEYLNKAVATQFVVTDEQRTLLEACARELDNLLLKEPVQILHEKKVHLRHPNGDELNHGHYDVLLIYKDGYGILIDWKFGWIPVPDAQHNVQGEGYAAACFQEYSALNRITMVFVQPKLNRRSEWTFDRQELFAMYQHVRGIIAAAQAEDKVLRPNPYCDFCDRRGTCSALVKVVSDAVVKYEGLPVEDIVSILKGAEIQTQQQAAVAYYYIDRMKAILEEADVRGKVLEFAKMSGGHLTAQLPDGRIISVDVKTRKSPRSVDSPALVAEALQDFLSPQQVLTCCDINITKLDEVFSQTVVTRSQERAKAILEQAEKGLAGATSKVAEHARKQAQTAAKNQMLTKKAGKELLDNILRSEGLISTSDKLVEYLKMHVEKSITPTPALVLPKQTTPAELEAKQT
jgi:hypothetical protein